jgi:uncharacterized protein (TIGR00290 family)
MNKKRILLSWSSGKDSAWTLHVLKQNPDIEVVGLLTSFNAEFDRVAMHATRRELVELQAKAADLPLFSVHLPWPCSNNDYEQAITSKLMELKTQYGITHVAFGDLFLQDIREYREAQMKKLDLEPLFPIWDLPTDQLAQTMITSGLKARITCIDPKKLPASFAGRLFDQDLINDLPEEIDHCGERGEFHTYTFAGPMLSAPIDIKPGEVVERDGFIFSDLILKTS